MEEKPKTAINSVEKSSTIYPERLRSLSGMPDMLYYIGRLPDDNRPTAAIVGARMCSPYGRIQAFNYGRFLSENGVQVISGMAAGIDAEGQKGALEGGTPTFAVLGNGVDICYPSSSRSIYRRIPEKNGGIRLGITADLHHFHSFFRKGNCHIGNCCGFSDAALSIYCDSDHFLSSAFVITLEYAVFAETPFSRPIFPDKELITSCGASMAILIMLIPFSR